MPKKGRLKSSTRLHAQHTFPGRTQRQYRNVYKKILATHPAITPRILPNTGFGLEACKGLTAGEAGILPILLLELKILEITSASLLMVKQITTLGNRKEFYPMVRSS